MLNNLKRYDFSVLLGAVFPYESDHGDYVKWEDVQEILAKDEPEVLLHIQATYPDGRTRQFTRVANLGPVTDKVLNEYCENLRDLLIGFGDRVKYIEVLSFSKLDA